jgi:hypothetical protein
MSVVKNFSCDVNEHLNVTDTVTSDGTPTGTPVNITGQSLVVNVHRNLGDGLPLLTYSTALGTVTIPTGTDGKFLWTMPNADILTLGVGTAFYVAYRVDPGFEVCYTKGKFSVRPV